VNKYNVYWQDKKKGLELLKEDLTHEEAIKFKFGVKKENDPQCLHVVSFFIGL